MLTMQPFRYYTEWVTYYLHMAHDLMSALLSGVFSLICAAIFFVIVTSPKTGIEMKIGLAVATLVGIYLTYWFVRDYVPKPKPKREPQTETL